MVIRGDSWSEGHGFKSQPRILDGHFHIYLLRKLQCLFEKTKINEKEAGDSQFLKSGSRN